jgi:hypothetical protein
MAFRAEVAEFVQAVLRFHSRLGYWIEGLFPINGLIEETLPVAVILKIRNSSPSSS